MKNIKLSYKDFKILFPKRNIENRIFKKIDAKINNKCIYIKVYLNLFGKITMTLFFPFICLLSLINCKESLKEYYQRLFPLKYGKYRDYRICLNEETKHKFKKIDLILKEK